MKEHSAGFEIASFFLALFSPEYPANLTDYQKHAIGH